MINLSIMGILGLITLAIPIIVITLVVLYRNKQ